MTLSEVDVRIRYFHDASDDHLQLLGVDRTLLPEPRAWHTAHEADYARPLNERDNYLLVWLLDDAIVGFSSLDHIAIGDEAFMHLHIVDPSLRGRGLGASLVRLSATHYAETFGLVRLFCEPNALNAAPNRTLRRAGFTYVLSRFGTPGPFNFPQVTTLWVLQSEMAASCNGPN
jgi:RimJ/RimL family protein N-acetyltransferase